MYAFGIMVAVINPLRNFLSSLFLNHSADVQLATLKLVVNVVSEL